MVGSPDSSRPGRSPRSRSNPTSGQNSPQHPELPHSSAELVPQPHLPLPTLPECSASSSSMADEIPGASQALGFSETHSLMNSFPGVEGFLGENWDEEAVLQQVLAQSQQEYFDQFKKNSEKPASAEQQMEGVDDGDGGALGKSGQDSS